MRSTSRQLQLGMIALLLVLAAASWLITARAARAYFDEHTQQLNASLAMYVAEEAPLIVEGTVDLPAFARLTRQAMVVNPLAEVYLLDTAGRVIAGPERLGAPIELGAIRAFLGADHTGPIYAQDPRRPGARQVFSAAEIRGPHGSEGYVFVVLGGARTESTVAALRESYILKTTLATLAVVALLAALGAWALAAVLTRPTRELHARVLRLGDELAIGAPPSTNRDDADLAAVRVILEGLADRLRAHVGQLAEVDRMRRELFSNISHDLRTPLTAMRGYLDTLAAQDERLDRERAREFLAITQRHCDRLTRLVDQVFALARLEVGTAPLRPEPVSLAELAQDIVRKFQLPSREAGVQLQLEVDPNAPLVAGDVGMLETVLENLLDNALRHSPAGSEVVVSVAARDGGIRAGVRDRGAGIEPQDLERIMRPFETGPGGRTGLGLAIVSRVLQLHGSRLELDSAVGRGTWASFRLPALERVDVEAAQTPKKSALRRDDLVIDRSLS